MIEYTQTLDFGKSYRHDVYRKLFLVDGIENPVARHGIPDRRYRFQAGIFQEGKGETLRERVDDHCSKS